MVKWHLKHIIDTIFSSLDVSNCLYKKMYIKKVLLDTPVSVIRFALHQCKDNKFVYLYIISGPHCINYITKLRPRSYETTPKDPSFISSTWKYSQRFHTNFYTWDFCQDYLLFLKKFSITICINKCYTRNID